MEYTMIWWDINEIYHALIGILLDYTMIEWDIIGLYHDWMGY